MGGKEVTRATELPQLKELLGGKKPEGFPFHHEHPAFKDRDPVQRLCEPRTFHVRTSAAACALLLM